MEYAFSQIQFALDTTKIQNVSLPLIAFILLSWIVGRKLMKVPAHDKLTIWWSAVTGLIVGVGIAYIQCLWDLTGRVDFVRGEEILGFFSVCYAGLYLFYSVCAGSLAYFSARASSSKHVQHLAFLAISTLSVVYVSISPVIPYLVEESWRKDARIALESANEGNYDEANLAFDRLLEDLKPSGGWQPAGLPISSSVSDLEGTLDLLLTKYSGRTADLNRMLDRLREARKASESEASGRVDLFLIRSGRFYQQNKNIEKALACYRRLGARDAAGVSREFGAQYSSGMINDCLSKAGRYEEVEKTFLEKAPDRRRGSFLRDYVSWCNYNDQRARALELTSKVTTKFYKGQITDSKVENELQSEIESTLIDLAEAFGRSKTSNDLSDCPTVSKICMSVTSKYKNIYPDADHAIERAVELLIKCGEADKSLQSSVEKTLSDLLENPQLPNNQKSKYMAMQKGFNAATTKPGPETDKWD